MKEKEEKSVSVFTKIWQHPSFWKVVSGVVIALTSLYVGIAEKWFDNKQLQEKQTQEIKLEEWQLTKKRLQIDDSVRIKVRESGIPRLMLDYMRIKSGNCDCKNPIERVSLVRWSRSNPYLTENFENYNIVSILYEITESTIDKIKPQFDNKNINYGTPFIKSFLQKIVENRRTYIYRSYRPETYDSATYGLAFRDWYYSEYRAEAHVVTYLGKTEDLKEHWFMSVWVDSVAFENQEYYNIMTEIYNTSNMISDILILEK